MKISELYAGMVNLDFEPDLIEIEKKLVEVHSCPDCRRNLIYKGFKSETETRCFGVCKGCDYAKKIYFNSRIIADGKRRFLRARG